MSQSAPVLSLHARERESSSSMLFFAPTYVAF